MSTNIDINIKAKDNASKTIKEVAKTQDEMKKSTSELQKQQNELKKSTDALEKEQDSLEDSTKNVTSSLNENERKQLANVQASGQLKEAQGLLSDAQRKLSQAIDEYGAESEEATAALREYNSAQATVNGMQKELTQTTKQTSVSFKDLVTSASGLATGVMGLYNTFDNLQDKQLAVDKANLLVDRSQRQLEITQQDAKKASVELEQASVNLEQAIDAYGVESDEARAAQEKADQATRKYSESTSKLAIEQQNLKIKQEEVENAQENLNTSMANAAITVVPQLITAVDSGSKLFKSLSAIGGEDGIISKVKGGFSALNDIDFSGITNKITSLTEKSGGLLANLAQGGLIAGGIAATVTGALTTQQRESERYAAVTGKEAPWWMQVMQGITGATLGGIIASQTSPIPSPKETPEAVPPNYWNLPKGAKGAVIDKPTALLAGEGGETELLTPESKLREIVREQSRGSVINNFHISVGGDTSYRTRQQIEQAVNQAVVKASSSGAPATSKRIIPKRSSNILARSNLR